MGLGKGCCDLPSERTSNRVGATVRACIAGGCLPTPASRPVASRSSRMAVLPQRPSDDDGPRKTSRCFCPSKHRKEETEMAHRSIARTLVAAGISIMLGSVGTAAGAIHLTLRKLLELTGPLTVAAASR